MITLVLGGARSGKSRHAQQLALQRSACPVYLATARIWDDDFRARIERHKAERGPAWTSIEEDRALGRLDLTGRVVVVDCLTLWLTNVFIDLDNDFERTLEEAKAELDKLLSQPATLIFVSNELGSGLHAETAIGRKFVDLQGFLNQYVAALADEVVLMVAGLPLRVKPSRTETHG